MKKSKTGAPDPLHVQKIFPEIVRQLGLERRAQEFSVLSLWEQVLAENLPPLFHQKTEAVKLKLVGDKRQLIVRVENASLASELMFHREKLQRLMNAFSPQTGITIEDIILRVGKVD